MSIKDEFSQLTELERACKLLDELICLRGMQGQDLGVPVVREAMEMVVAARKNNSDYPVTLWLLDKLKERKLI